MNDLRSEAADGSFVVSNNETVATWTVKWFDTLHMQVGAGHRCVLPSICEPLHRPSPRADPVAATRRPSPQRGRTPR